MSEIELKKTRPRAGYDNRSFMEIWYSLPDVAKQSLINALKKAGFNRVNWFWWVNGCVPTADNRAAIVRALKKCFGVKTKPETLFPGDSNYRKTLAKQLRDHYAQLQWDGKVKWQKPDDTEGAEEENEESKQ